MNQHINMLEDPVVAQLRKGATTSDAVHRNRRFIMPRMVREPGKLGFTNTHRVRSNHRSQPILTK
jgi:hypothetical protein